MKFRRFFLSLLFSTVAALRAGAYVDVYFTSVPSSVESGQTYYVEAAVDTDSGSDVNLWKNGGYFSGYSGWGYATFGGYTSDSGPQTITYSVEGNDWSSGWSDYDYANVTVTQSNQPPSATVEVDGYGSGATVTRPYGGSVTVTVRYKATDANGNLSGIRPQVWDPAGNLNNNGGAFIGQSGGSGEVVWTVTLNQNGDWYFWTDAQDPVIAPGYVDSGAWGIAFRLNVVEGAPPNTAPVASVWADTYSLYTGQSTWVHVRAQDADGNASWLNLDELSPVSGGFFGNGGNNVNAMSPDNNGLYGIGAQSDYTRSLYVYFPQPGTYVFRAAAGDSGPVSYSNSNIAITVPNRDPTVSIQILDAAQNVIGLDGNGRARIYTNTTFYIRVNGSDPDGRLLRLYSRVNDAGGVGYAYEQRDVSGGSASWTFGPYATGTSVGIWDVWAHAEDQDNTGYQWQGGGWWGSHAPDIEVIKRDQAITFNQPAAQTYGTQLTLSTLPAPGAPTASSGLAVSYAIIPNPSSVASLGHSAIGDLTFTGVGNVTVRVSQAGNGNYYAAATVDRIITVNPAPASFALNKTFTYDGLQKTVVPLDVVTTPSGVTFALGGTTFATNATTYTATATANGNYTGTNSGLNWTINKANQAAVTINSAASMTYGTPYTATVTLGSGLGTGTGAIVWSLGTGSTAVGAAINSSSGAVTANSTGTVVIKAQRAADTNYFASAWTADFTVTVGARPITVTLAGSKTYDGNTTAAGASASVTVGSLAPGDSIGCAYAATSSANTGSYPALTTATITNATAPAARTGSYNITYNGSYAINRATVTAATITPRVYTGGAQSPSTVSSTTPAGATVSVSAPAQINVGTYATATVTGTGNYTGTLSNVSWSITAASQAPVTIDPPTSTTYGTAYTAHATGGSGNGAYVWALGSGSTAAGAAINSSSGVVTANSTGTVVIKVQCAADTNYLASAWTADYPVTVTPCPITVTFSGSKIADGTTTVTGASASITSGNLSAGDSIGYAFAATSSASPGSYTGLAIPTITNVSAPATRTGSYAITYTGNYIIRAVITAATIVPLNYNGTAQSPSAASSTTPAGATVSVSAPAQTNAGIYPTATVTGTGDFAGTLYNVPWSISQVAQYPLVINSDNWMIYLGGYTATTTGGSGTGAVKWELGTGSTALGAAINSSTGAVTSNGTGKVFIRAKKWGDNNYPELGWTSDFEIRVLPADQTITFPNPGPQTYLTPLTLAAAASSGLPVSYLVTAGPASVTGNTVTFSSIGTVTVEASQLGDGNYKAASPVSQTFVVNPAPTTFVLSATAFTYNGTAQGPTVVPTPGSATFTTGGTLSATAPGNYTATATASGNYIGSSPPLTWIINKATPVVVFQNPRDRGTQTPTTYTVQPGDLNASVLPVGAGVAPTGPVTYSIIAASGPGASPASGPVTTGTVFTIGSYTIRAAYSGVGDPNYNSTSVDAVWNILLDVDRDGIPGYIEVLLGLDPNVPNNQNDGSNQTQLKIHRPNQ